MRRSRAACQSFSCSFLYSFSTVAADCVSPEVVAAASSTRLMRSARAVPSSISTNAPQAHFARGDRELRRQVRHKTLHDWFDGTTYNRIHRSAHSGIAKKGSATGKNLFVCRLHVGVGAEDSGDFAIEKTGERN